MRAASCELRVVIEVVVKGVRRVGRCLAEEPSQRLRRWADSEDICISEARVFISISCSERVVAMWSGSRGAGGWWRVGVWAEEKFRREARW